MDKAQLTEELRSCTSLIYVKTHDFPAHRDWLISLKVHAPLVIVSEANPWEVIRDGPTDDWKRSGPKANKPSTVIGALRAALQAPSGDTTPIILFAGADAYFDNPVAPPILRGFADQALIDERIVKMVILFGVTDPPESMLPILKIVVDQGPTIDEIRDALTGMSKNLRVNIDSPPEAFVGYSLFQIKAAFIQAWMSCRKKLERSEALPQELVNIALADRVKAYP